MNSMKSLITESMLRSKCKLFGVTYQPGAKLSRLVLRWGVYIHNSSLRWPLITTKESNIVMTYNIILMISNDWTYILWWVFSATMGVAYGTRYAYSFWTPGHTFSSVFLALLCLLTSICVNVTVFLFCFLLPEYFDTCNGHIYNNSGNITSPDFSTHYNNEEHCQLLVTVDKGRRIQFVVDEFLLEHCTECGCDYVQVQCNFWRRR